MKHCPNPDCGGIAKFKTISEFNDTAEICSDCQTTLVDGPAPRPEELGGRPAPDPDMELVPILVARDQAQLILIEEALEMAEIRYMAKGEQIQDLFGFGRLTVVNPVTGPVEIYVTSTDADAARKAVAEILG
ncbi:MAG: DUF2007 domain-containing protein [Candidatus Krumholzibacteriota bacterium]